MKTQTQRVKDLLSTAAEFVAVGLEDGMFEGMTDAEIAEAALAFVIEDMSMAKEDAK